MEEDGDDLRAGRSSRHADRYGHAGDVVVGDGPCNVDLLKKPTEELTTTTLLP